MKVGHRSFPRHKTVTKERIWATAELVEAGLIDVSLGDCIEVGERPEGTRKVVDVPEVPYRVSNLDACRRHDSRPPARMLRLDRWAGRGLARAIYPVQWGHVFMALLCLGVRRPVMASGRR